MPLFEFNQFKSLLNYGIKDLILTGVLGFILLTLIVAFINLPCLHIHVVSTDKKDYALSC